MKRLVVTADIHGSYATWLVLRQLLTAEDGLVIAGDFFGTRYGNYFDSDFQPDTIRREVKELSQPIFYVYGNCDNPDFFPGYNETLFFEAFNKQVFLYHGHKHLSQIPKADIIIQGHTHIYELKKEQARIFMNPGSITNPRNNIPSYGIIEKGCVNIFSLRKEILLVSLTI